MYLGLLGMGKGAIPSAPLGTVPATHAWRRVQSAMLAAVLEQWHSLAGASILPGQASCRALASHPGKHLLPGPCIQSPILCFLAEIPSDNLAAVFGCPPASLAAGVATTARAQVRGTSGPLF